MRFRCGKWCKVIFVLYMICSSVTFFFFIKDVLDSVREVPVSNMVKQEVIVIGDTTRAEEPVKNGSSVVEIWGKAAIGLYLWQHIFEGPLHRVAPGWNSGEILVQEILFRFHTGPGVTLETVPLDVSNVLLVLNGREQTKIEFALDWLDYVTNSPGLNSVGVVLLGNEQCGNAWVRRYMKKAGGPVKYLFVVYDSIEVDDDFIFQWPLGVATYRNFPAVVDEVFDISSPRKYICNFLGTIYPNSSREVLLRVLRSSQFAGKCYVKERLQWQPKETDESLQSYIDAIKNSDLTLNPIGMNPECYRIYEAMSYGSVPVIEDRSTSLCGGWSQNRSRVLRLLKKHGAPVIYIDDWNKLPELLELESMLTTDEIVARRRTIVEWYTNFRRKMRDFLVDVVSSNI